jgi:hypothetical protein
VWRRHAMRERASLFVFHIDRRLFFAGCCAASRNSRDWEVVIYVPARGGVLHGKSSPGRPADFPPAEPPVGEGRRENLDGNVAVELGIAGAIHVPTAHAEWCEDLIGTEFYAGCERRISMNTSNRPGSAQPSRGAR